MPFLHHVAECKQQREYGEKQTGGGSDGCRARNQIIIAADMRAPIHRRRNLAAAVPSAACQSRMAGFAIMRQMAGTSLRNNQSVFKTVLSISGG